MLSKILGTKKNTDENSKSVDPELIQKISKMNLTDMRVYIKDRLKDFKLSTDGLNEVLKKLVNPNDKGKFYIKTDDMDSKKRKAFELILIIATSKKISLESIELIQNFTEIYAEVIYNYDRANKDIYSDRLKKAISNAIVNLQTISHVNRKLDYLK